MGVVVPSASRTSESLGAEWEKQLELAIAWNRVDIAETEIFTEESQWKVGRPITQHNKTPRAAICLRRRCDKNEWPSHLHYC